jgi:hypothetical protein
VEVGGEEFGEVGVGSWHLGLPEHSRRVGQLPSWISDHFPEVHVGV